MSKLSIKSQKRDIVGKKVKSLRSESQVPAAIYGKGYPTVNISVDAKEFVKIFNEAGHSAIVDVKIDGKDESTLISEVQIDTVTRKPIHISFHKINLKEEITADIPLIFVGEETSMAIKEGGIVVTSMPQLEVKCLPVDLPQNIEIDISKMAIGENLSIKDIKLPKGVELVHGEEEDLNIVVVSITEPTKEEEPVAAPVAEAAPATETKTEEAK